DALPISNTLTQGSSSSSSLQYDFRGIASSGISIPLISSSILYHLVRVKSLSRILGGNRFDNCSFSLPKYTKIVSDIPVITVLSTIGTLETLSNPSSNTTRYPARLPLSTVDTYSGFRGRRVLVSYQLYICPFHFSILFKVYTVASVLSMSSKIPI